jgi:predicted NAD-dependent protein-ADP-ribosyltransferase YbiA (DUF1768 family)
MNAMRYNEIDYPGIEASDEIARVIEKPDGMRVTIFTSGSVVLRPPSGAPKTHLRDGRLFIEKDGQVVEATPKRALPLHRRHLNVISNSPDEIGRQLSNFAERRFVMDDRVYASIEGWYQGLKWPEAAQRAEAAKLSGSRAKNAAKGAPKAATFVYEGRTYAFGSEEHHGLVKIAIRTSLAQHPEVKAALVATRPRPIVHNLGRKERPGTALPATKFARILEEIREEFAAEVPAQ